MLTKSPRYSKEEFAQRGDEIYDRRIRPIVENAENHGKFVLIDIETGDWEIDIDDEAASRRMNLRLPDAQIWMVRVGIPYVYRFGADMTFICQSSTVARSH